MNQLTRGDLYSLEEYAVIRRDFRKKVMAHKKNRRLSIGPNATLYFEDRLSMQYQLQEMLRAECIFEAAGIEEELETYNPMISDGSNWKATFMIEYVDEADRRLALAEMLGIEKAVWVQIDDLDKVFPIADEDLERETEDKTSAVHFLRFELGTDMIAALKSGATLSAGIKHAAYEYTVSPVAQNIRDALMVDLD